MRKFFARVWSALNSPVADIIVGLFFYFVGIYGLVRLYDIEELCFRSLVAGVLLAVGLGTYDFGLFRLSSCQRKHPQGPPSDDCQP